MFESTRIKILVIPVGRILRSEFEEQYNLLKQSPPVPLTKLNSSSSDPFTGSEFRESFINYEFCLNHDDDCSALEEFQKSKSILGIIGLMTKSQEDLSTFKNIQSRYRSAIVNRCITIKENIMDFLCELSIDILRGFREIASSIEFRSVIHSPPASELGFAGTSYLDFQTSLIPILGIDSTSEAAKLKKRSTGRAQKLIADLLLLSGNYPVAATMYATAFESAKQQNDVLWITASLDGYFTAILAIRDLGVDVPENISEIKDILKPTATISEIISKFQNLIGAYERAEAPLLVIETCCRLLNGLSDFDIKPNLKRQTSAVSRMFGQEPKNSISIPEMCIFLTQAMSRCQNISIRTRLSLLLKTSLIFAKNKCLRKQGFFLMAAVQLIIEILTAKTSKVVFSNNVTLMENLAQLYGLMTPHQIGWPELQMEVLEQCILVSEILEDVNQLTVLIIKCFARFQSMFSLDGLLNLVKKMQKVTNVVHNSANFKFCKSIKMLHNSNLPQKVRNEQNLYLSSPEKQKEKSVICCFESCSFLVCLRNPFSFKITLESLSLLTKGVEFNAEETHLSIGPDSTLTLELRGVPQTTGILEVLGCKFKFFGVDEISFVTNPQDLNIKQKKTGMELAMDLKTETIEPLCCSVPVVDQIPELSFRILGTSQHSLSLLEGQMLDLTLEITNKSNLDCTHLDLKSKETKILCDQDDAVLVYNYERYDLQHELISLKKVDKVPAKQTIKVDIKAYGKLNCTGAEISIIYSSNSLYFRTNTLNLNVNVSKVCKISDFNISSNALHFDFTNKHLTPISINLSSGIQSTEIQVPISSTKRCGIEVPLCDLEEHCLLEPIPQLKLKQFILKKSLSSAFSIREKSLCFWLQKYLYDQLQCTWSSRDGFHGTLDLSDIQVLPEHIPLIWKHSTLVSFSCKETSTPNVLSLGLSINNRDLVDHTFVIQLSSTDLIILGSHIKSLNVQQKSEKTIIVSALCCGQNPQIHCHTTRLGVCNFVSFNIFKIN